MNDLEEDKFLNFHGLQSGKSRVWGRRA
jgi:hypothetical protein